MNQDLIEKLNHGIYLESNKLLLPWRTHFESLKHIGTPEFRETSDQRVDLIWKNEVILNGLHVDLIAMRWFGITGMNNTLKHVHAYLSEEEFKNTIARLETELGKKGDFKKINSLEFKYTWKLTNCKVKLIQGDRFGTNWSIEIQHKSSWYGFLK